MLFHKRESLFGKYHADKYHEQEKGVMSKEREGGRVDYCLEQDPSMNIHVNSTFKGNSTGFVRTAHQAKIIKEN